MYIRLFYEDPRISYGGLFKKKVKIKERGKKELNGKVSVDFEPLKGIERIIVETEKGQQYSKQTATYSKEGELLNILDFHSLEGLSYKKGQDGLMVRQHTKEGRTTWLLRLYFKDKRIKSAEAINLETKEIDFNILCQRNKKGKLLKETVEAGDYTVETKYDKHNKIKEIKEKLGKKVLSKKIYSD